MLPSTRLQNDPSTDFSNFIHPSTNTTKKQLQFWCTSSNTSTSSSPLAIRSSSYSSTFSIRRRSCRRCSFVIWFGTCFETYFQLWYSGSCCSCSWNWWRTLWCTRYCSSCTCWWAVWSSSGCGWWFGIWRTTTKVGRDVWVSSASSSMHPSIFIIPRNC